MIYRIEQPEITSNYLDNLLIKRGITDVESFKHPKEEHMLPPMLLHNMDKAITTIHDNIDKNIALLVDADCDGFTSSTIIYKYLTLVNPDVEITYFLHDGKQHGLQDMMEKITNKFDLLIIPDASSNDYEYHQKLAEEGVSIVILDHHMAEKESEYAIVVNNQLSDYENKELTGAGVAYKFCQAYDACYGYNYANKFLDLAAVGIIGDMSTNLHPETRYIIKTGLANIENNFLNALIEKQAFSLNKASTGLTPISIAFYIVPLINALIRVGKDSEKEAMFKAFICETTMVQSTKRGAKPGDVESIAQQAARSCVNAKSRQTRQKEKALDSIEMTIKKNSLNDNKILLVPVEDDSIDTTLTGLIAMQLVAKYNKPVLLGRESTDGYLRGSGRCPDKTAMTNFREFLEKSGYFSYAEGHAQAFGHEISLKNIDKFISYSNEVLKDVDFTEGIYDVDFIKEASSSAEISDIIMSVGTAADLWGQGNPEPYIVIKNIYLNQEDLCIMGASKDSVKFSIGNVDCCRFKDGDFIDKLRATKNIKLTVIGRANINRFMGNESPQLFIDAYELNDTYYDF